MFQTITPNVFTDIDIYQQESLVMEQYVEFDERASGSSQILYSYLMRRSGVRYDTKNLHTYPTFAQ